MLLVSKLDRDERIKSEPDFRYGLDFQGKQIRPCKSQIYWYRWGEYTFDIRDIRKKFKQQEHRAIDLDFKINPCTKFQKIAGEVVNLIGDVPFLELFKPYN